MCLSGLMVKTPVRKTGDLRFKSRLRQKFLSVFIITVNVAAVIIYLIMLFSVIF